MATALGPPLVDWCRWSETGYEVSSAGDRRFSALYAELEDGRTIEMHYQCDVKGFKPGSTAWRLYKGKTGNLSPSERWKGYLRLWEAWAKVNTCLIAELDAQATANGNILTDRFARSEVNQANALAFILNIKRLREWQML